uniref:Stress response protein NST1 n=1 Tax=Bionectria ochroleuca TaxID=29856 RepID=A0A8H7TIV0_BIOOC
MPTNHQKQAAHAPASPRNTSKYTNKDGSKFITVPKGAAAESSQPSTPTSNKPSESLPESTSHNSPMQTVNRKKQKRRQKAAAKAAAEQQIVNGHANRSSQSRPSRPEPVDYEDVNSEDDEGYEYEAAHEVTNGHSQQPLKSKKTKKKKKKKGLSGPDDNDALLSRVRSPGVQARGSGMSRDKIWSTSNQEERERIKEFWLGLGEDERKSLVKVEKDAVLKKMKEQQKHTCSCTVCGRKRTAIEEELETLYDAYYLELEQFANQGDGPPILASTRDFSSHPFRNMHSQYPPQSPSHGRIVEHVGEEDDDDDLEEVYSEDEGDDEEYSDDEPPKNTTILRIAMWQIS